VPLDPLLAPHATTAAAINAVIRIRIMTARLRRVPCSRSSCCYPPLAVAATWCQRPSRPATDGHADGRPACYGALMATRRLAARQPTPVNVAFPQGPARRVDAYAERLCRKRPGAHGQSR